MTFPYRAFIIPPISLPDNKKKMKETILLFDPSLKGHIMEYINMVWMGAYERKSSCRLILAVPKNEWESRSGDYTFLESNNIEFQWLRDDEIAQCTTGSLIRQAWYRSRIASKLCKKTRATHLFLNYLLILIPWVLFLLPKGCKVIGIVYRIYFYQQTNRLHKRLYHWFLYWVLSWHPNVRTVFILNDKSAAKKLCNTYGVERFKMIVDPAPEVKAKQLRNLRKELSIPKEQRIILQFGSMERRKNIDKVLEASLSIPQEQVEKITFIFQGIIKPDVQELVNSKIEELKKRTQVIMIPHFVSYETLYNLCYTADIILTCYDSTEQSSGSIGYASAFNTPVIGPSEGLLGVLIRDYKLGITINEITPQKIKEAMLVKVLPTISPIYSATHTKQLFIDTIYSSMTL